MSFLRKWWYGATPGETKVLIEGRNVNPIAEDQSKIKNDSYIQSLAILNNKISLTNYKLAAQVTGYTVTGIVSLGTMVSCLYLFVEEIIFSSKMDNASDDWFEEPINADWDTRSCYDLSWYWQSREGRPYADLSCLNNVTYDTENAADYCNQIIENYCDAQTKLNNLNNQYPWFGSVPIFLASTCAFIGSFLHLRRTFLAMKDPNVVNPKLHEAFNGETLENLKQVAKELKLNPEAIRIKDFYNKLKTEIEKDKQSQLIYNLFTRFLPKEENVAEENKREVPTLV